MPIYTKVSGEIKEMSDAKVKVSGSWKQVDQILAKEIGTWKDAWRNSIVYEFTYDGDSEVVTVPGSTTRDNVVLFSGVSMRAFNSSGSLIAEGYFGDITARQSTQLYYVRNNNGSVRIQMSVNILYSGEVHLYCNLYGDTTKAEFEYAKVVTLY